MKLKEILKKLSSGVTQTKSPYENRTLCGVPLRVLPNTTRVKEDQDDCWWFYLTKNHNVIYDVGSNAGYSAIIAYRNFFFSINNEVPFCSTYYLSSM